MLPSEPTRWAYNYVKSMTLLLKDSLYWALHSSEIDIKTIHWSKYKVVQIWARLIFYKCFTVSGMLLTLEVTSLPSLSGSCELVQSCLSSTREMSEQKVSVSVNNALLSNFLLQNVSNHQKFFRGSKNSLEKHVSPELYYSNGVKNLQRWKREWRTCCIIVDHKHQSAHDMELIRENRRIIVK